MKRNVWRAIALVFTLSVIMTTAVFAEAPNDAELRDARRGISGTGSVRTEQPDDRYSSQAAAAPGDGLFEDFSFAVLDGYTTVITDTAGNDHAYPGVLQPTSLEKHTAVSRVAAYVIYCGEERLLTVQLHDIVPENGKDQYSAVTGKEATNGYYSIELPVGTGFTAFLTGLSPKYLAEMQASVLDAILSGSFLSLEDISFIDTEKQYDIVDKDGRITDSDFDMCWAASTANILYYTGWAKQAGIYSADYMFEELIDQFGDYGGKCEFGLQWFFNGYNPAQDWNNWPRDESGYVSFAGYQPEYCYASVVQELDLEKTPENLCVALDALKAGDGVEINFGWYNNWARTGGHSVTLWGAVYRTGSDLTNKNNWQAIIISDSDSDVTYGDNRRTAPNTLNLYQITPVNEAGCDSWYIDEFHYDYASGIPDNGILEGVTLLKAYDESLPKDGGTRNTVTSPDIALNTIETAELTPGIPNYTPYFAKDSLIGVRLVVENQAHQACTQSISYSATLTKRGNVTPVWSDSGMITAAAMADDYEVTPTLYIGKLESGVYELTATLSCDGDAYLANNTLTKTIYVSNRAMSQDHMDFHVDTFFDGAPNQDYYGTDSVGRLAFSNASLPGYEVDQYTVSVEYFSGNESLGVEDLYCGPTLPAEVYGLKAKGDSICVAVYATPKDPMQGYECYAGTSRFNIYYFRIDAYAEKQNFTIFETDTGLRNNEKIHLSFEKTAANKSDSDFYLAIYADDMPIYTGWISSTEFGTHSSMNWYISGFTVYNSGVWENVTLPAGSYTLSARANYGTDNDGYYLYRDYVEFGTLTVLANGYKKLEVREPEVIGTTAVIGYSFETPSDDFTVRVDYESEQGSGWASRRYSGWNSGYVSGSIKVSGLQPETEYTYTVFVFDGTNPDVGAMLTSESGSFTTEEAVVPIDPPIEEPPVFTLLDPGETTLALTYGEEAYLESFVPSEGGTWEFSFSGPDGYVRVWDETAEDWGEIVYFTQSGETLNIAVEQGKSVRLLVRGLMAGEYTVSYEPTAYTYVSDDTGFYLGVTSANGRGCTVAVYSAQGQMLSVTVVGAEGQVVSVTDANAAKMRIFRYGKTTYAPAGEPVEFDLMQKK